MCWQHKTKIKNVNNKKPSITKWTILTLTTDISSNANKPLLSPQTCITYDNNTWLNYNGTQYDIRQRLYNNFS